MQPKAQPACQQVRGILRFRRGMVSSLAMLVILAAGFLGLLGRSLLAVRSDREEAPKYGGENGWHYSEVPNPFKDPFACRLPVPGWFCDPDGLLSSHGREQVNDVLLAIREETRVRCPQGMRGYQVGVAVVDKMHEEDWVRGDKAATAQRFAEKIGDSWGVGDMGCGNGIMLFMSISDRYAYIKTNSNRSPLTSRTSTNIVDNMKPLLRREEYDKAVLLAAVQIADVLHGRSIPRASSGGDGISTWLVLGIFALFMLPFVLPLGLMCVGGICTCVLMPFAYVLDLLSGCCRGCCGSRRQRELHQAAERDLQRVQREMSRDEYDQSMCPICLGDLNIRAASSTMLECRHCFHRNCIQEWLREHDSCPLCRARTTGGMGPSLSPEDERMPREYRERLRFYMSRVQYRHSDAYDSTSWPMYTYDRYNNWTYGPYYGTRRRNYWYNDSTSSSYYVQTLQSRYSQLTKYSNGWLSKMQSSSGRSSSSSSGGGGYSFGGGGGFSGGGGRGGGGGW